MLSVCRVQVDLPFPFHNTLPIVLNAYESVPKRIGGRWCVVELSCLYRFRVCETNRVVILERLCPRFYKFIQSRLSFFKLCDFVCVLQSPSPLGGFFFYTHISPLHS